MGQMLTSDSKKKQLEGLKLIDEQVSSVQLELVEGQGAKAGKIFARGEFGHAAKPTANGRLYPPQIWESNIQRLSGNLRERKVLGELDHPSDGRTALQRASHVITDLRLEGERVIGEAEILNTAKGRDLKAILEAGVPVGISSRGYGSTKPDGKGKEVVQEDYKLVTFDFVAEPADNTAYPDVFFEGVEFPEVPVEEEEDVDEGEARDGENEGSDEDSPNEENEEAVQESLEEAVAVQVSSMSDEEKELARKFLSVASQAPVAVNTEALRKEFSSEILSHISEMRGEVEETVRQELLADPEVGGARSALEQVSRVLRPFLLPEDVNELIAEKDEEISSLQRSLKEKDLQMEELKQLVDKLAEAAKESGYKYHLERLISGESEADLIRSIVGDVTQYDSADSIASKVEEAREHASSRRLEENQEDQVRSARTVRLEAKSGQLAEALEEALVTNKQLALRLYARDRLQTHPKAAKILRMLESTGYRSQDQVDALIEEFREPVRDRDDLDDIRTRVRRRLYGGSEHLQESTRRSPTGENYNGLGMPLGELMRLSGLENR